MVLSTQIRLYHTFRIIIHHINWHRWENLQYFCKLDDCGRTYFAIMRPRRWPRNRQLSVKSAVSAKLRVIWQFLAYLYILLTFLVVLSGLTTNFVRQFINNGFLVLFAILFSSYVMLIWRHTSLLRATLRAREWRQLTLYKDLLLSWNKLCSTKFPRNLAFQKICRKILHFFPAKYVVPYGWLKSSSISVWK